MKAYLIIFVVSALLITLTGCPQSTPSETVTEPVETTAPPTTQAPTDAPETTIPPETRPANMTDLH